MDLDRLYAILDATTSQFRKGPEVEQRTLAGHNGPVDVVEVYAMPHTDDAPAGVEKVDCEFLVIGVDKEKAESYRNELRALLRTYPEPTRLAGGPSYIEVGGVLGDQAAAFRLFALGQVLGFWRVMTPRGLGFVGEEARELAGNGMIMITGFKEVPQT